MTKAILEMPRIGWIHLSDDDIDQAKRLIASMKEEEAADSLGLQPMADLMADWLYPGLTTPMTHARYFIFLPTLFRGLEEGRHSNVTSVRATAKRLQLTQVVVPLGPVKGNIGRKSAANLERWPATIYWNGLRTLGIFARPMSEQRYYAALVQRSGHRWLSEDGIEHDDDLGFWDEKCPEAKLRKRDIASTGKRLSFKLTLDEATARANHHRDLAARVQGRKTEEGARRADARRVRSTVDSRVEAAKVTAGL